MQRLYPLLLLTMIALTAAIWMRPSLGEEFLSLLGSGAKPECPSGDYIGPPPGAYPGPSSLESERGRDLVPQPSYAPARGVPDEYGPYPQPDRSGPAIEARPADIETIGHRYPTAGAAEDWPRPSQTPPERYPVVGDGRPVVDAGYRAVNSRGDWRNPEPAGHPPLADSVGPAWNEPPDYADDPSARLGGPRPYGAPPVWFRGQAARYPPSPAPPPREAQRVPGEDQIGLPPPARPEIRLCEGAQVLARVGDDVILASEVAPTASELFASRKDQVPETQHELLRKVETMRVLRDLVGIKLIYQDAQRAIPAENFKNIQKTLAEQFEKTEVPKRMKQAEVGSRAELDQKLQELGTSLEREKRAFVQRVLAQQWMRERNSLDDRVSHEEMVNYYHEHIADYQYPARALWEKLTVRIPRYSDGSEAYAALARMGNQVMRGSSTEEVLKAGHEGNLECRGGMQGWITQGSLEASPVLESAIFGLPVGRLSRIFRDGEAFHVVRVLKREEFRQTSFEEADQEEIREKLRELRWQEQIQTYLARLRSEIPVWTVFDDDPLMAQLQRQSASRTR